MQYAILKVGVSSWLSQLLNKKYMTIKEVYELIALRYEATKKDYVDRRSDEETTLAWVMSLLEQTEEVNPSK